MRKKIYNIMVLTLVFTLLYKYAPYITNGVVDLIN